MDGALAFRMVDLTGYAKLLSSGSDAVRHINGGTEDWDAKLDPPVGTTDPPCLGGTMARRNRVRAAPCPRQPKGGHQQQQVANGYTDP